MKYNVVTLTINQTYKILQSFNTWAEAHTNLLFRLNQNFNQSLYIHNNEGEEVFSDPSPPNPTGAPV